MNAFFLNLKELCLKKQRQFLRKTLNGNEAQLKSSTKSLNIQISFLQCVFMAHF